MSNNHHHIEAFPDNMHQSVHGVEQFVSPNMSMKDVTDKIIAPLEGKISLGWWIGFGISILMLLCLVFSVSSQLVNGYGQTGINNPVGWGVYITDFVFWVGIGHAGTLISAILFIFRQKWRNSINRGAEAMTVFAVMCAGLFPLLHTGRIWVDFWLVPYPNMRDLWVNFRSPLLWDVFAVSTYFSTSMFFWYKGLIPDYATLKYSADTQLLSTGPIETIPLSSISKKYKWRDLLDIGFIESGDNGVNYPFESGAHYIYMTTRFYLQRQDPPCDILITNKIIEVPYDEAKFNYFLG